MQEGHFERHINRIRKIYRQRRDTIINNIKSSSLGNITEISGEGSGLHIVLSFKNGISQNEIISSAAEAGVKIHGLTEYYSFPVSDIPDNSVVVGNPARIIKYKKV